MWGPYIIENQWRTCGWLTGWSLLLFASLWWLASVPDENTGTTQTRTRVWNLPCAQMASILSPQLVSNTYPHANRRACARTHHHARAQIRFWPSAGDLPYCPRRERSMRHNCRRCMRPLKCESKCTARLTEHSYGQLHSRMHEHNTSYTQIMHP